MKEKTYLLSQLKKDATVEELIPEYLWVAYSVREGLFMEFAFYEFRSEQWNKPETIEVARLMQGEGPVDNLKECRHTYWGDGGYISYPNASHFRAVLDWLDKHYEMD